MIQFNRYPEGKPHCVTLSYDDGREFDIRLAELLRTYRLKGTFHLNSGKFGNPGYIRPDQVQETYAGHEISCHTVQHPSLDQVPEVEIIRQTMQDRETLERAAGYPVRGMSYPYGSYNEAVIRSLRACGIVYSRTVKSTGGFGLPGDFMAWHPTCHHRDSLECAGRFLDRAEKSWTSQLFYVWGHSYEFDQENNWELIEEFCKRISGLPNVWYATNIEIYDYIQAVRRLQFSADGRMAVNPSAVPVWFSVDGETVKAEPGAVIRL